MFQPGHPRYGGKQKGSRNKAERLRDLVFKALDQVGGLDYLARQAEQNPNAFLSLVGKLLPVNVEGMEQVSFIVIRNYTGAGPVIEHVPQSKLAETSEPVQ